MRVFGVHLRWYDVFWLLPAMLWAAVRTSSWESRIVATALLGVLAASWWLRPACECVCQ